MKFNGRDYKELISSIDGDFRFFPAVGTDRPDGRVVYLRHDIDGRPELAAEMALLELEMGIRSTYFVLNTHPYWKKEAELEKVIDTILGCGHEIGWHNAAVEEWFLDGKVRPMREYFTEPLQVLRERYGVPVRGTSAHYVSKPNDQTFRNYNAFNLPFRNYSQIPLEQYDLSEFGLEYETYFVTYDIYLCDSGKAWNEDPDAVIGLFNRMKNSILQLLIHPQWWCDK